MGRAAAPASQTLDIVSRIRREFEIEAVSHLTCVGSSREELAAYLDQARAAGITNIVALRGDAPQGR